MKMNSQQFKIMRQSKGSPERKFIAIQIYLKKIETFQINNLTYIYIYKNWRNNNKQSPERVKGRK